MRILQVHNYYQQAGGEDAVVAAEASLLRNRGNIVVPFYKTNDDIAGGRKTEDGGQPSSPKATPSHRRTEDEGRRPVTSRLSSVIGLLRVSAQTIWNWETYREFRKLLREEKPDVVHCHNTFPLISPSIYWACAKEGVPVVQTLHNYRLLCLNAFLFRQGRALNGSSVKTACGLVKNVETSRDRDSSNGSGDANFEKGHGDYFTTQSQYSLEKTAEKVRGERPEEINGMGSGAGVRSQARLPLRCRRNSASLLRLLAQMLMKTFPRTDSAAQSRPKASGRRFSLFRVFSVFRGDENHSVHNHSVKNFAPFGCSSSDSGCEKKVPRGLKPNQLNPNTSTSGAVCELCVSKCFKWPGIRYRCYRESLAASAVVALMLFVHKLIGTWSKKVSLYIALTEFQKQKMIEGGLPADKIFVKPNFIADGGEVLTATAKGRGWRYCDGRERSERQKRERTQKDGGVNGFNDLNGVLTSDSDLTCEQPFALFVGRLSPEKGCDVLIRAWALFCKRWAVEGRTSGSSASTCNDFNGFNAVAPQLLIVGEGPEREALESLASYPTSNVQLPTIHFLGQQSKERVLSLMRAAQFLVSPSVCYETFGLVVLEAGMQETPSLVSAPGAVASLIDDGNTGLLFKTGDSPALADKLEWAFNHASKMDRMGLNSQQKFAEMYSAEVNVRVMMEIFKGKDVDHV